MTGPRKQNSTKKMRTARPTIARRLEANSRSASCQPLWIAWTSPPSGSGPWWPGRLTPPIAPSASALSAASVLCSVNADPGIGDRDCHVRDQITDDRQHAAQNRVGEQDRVVLLAERVVEEQA